MLLFDKITNYSQDRFKKELQHPREQIKVKDKVNAYQMDRFPFPTIEFYTTKNFNLACHQHLQRFKSHMKPWSLTIRKRLLILQDSSLEDQMKGGQGS
jgi:hypothetical protein